MATQLQQPFMARSGASVHSHEGSQNAQQQPTMHPAPNQDMDEPPPPYQELPGEPLPVQYHPHHPAAVEYSVDNSPQLVIHDAREFIPPPPRNPARLASNGPSQSPARSPVSPQEPSLLPAPLSLRSPSTTFSSAKAREAGYELESPLASRRTESMSSAPSVTIHPSSEPLRFVREAGKVTAYLIPFPKPRIRGVEPEDIPDRFLIYTPPLPPLSKPAAGEKETHWHKTQRQWQEDVRKASVNKASITTWKGFKAGTTSLVHKGVAKTRSTNVEFIDRASGGALASEVEKEEEGQPAHVQATETEIPAELVADTPTSPSEASPAPISRTTASNTSSLDKDNKPTALEELTLIYPPSLPLSPEQIRTEFADTLLRTRASSRKDVLFASALLPFAATLDACLIVTFGGLTQVSGAWAYTSTRGALESKKIAKGLERGEQTALNNNNQEPDTESQISGCTCGHHEHDFGKPSTTSATPTPTPNVLEKATSYFTKTKAKDNGINLHLQQSPQLEILRRYLDLACLKREFNMFPAIEEAAGDVNEGSVLEAIGWRPVRRAGKDLEVDFKDRVEVLTPEEDEKYQVQEAREDVKRVFRKGAGEWVGWVKERGWVKEGKEKEKERK